MRAGRFLPFLVLLGALALAGGIVSAAGAIDPSPLQGLLSTALTNLSIAFIVVLLFIFGLYAYASLARFAPYHSWIYLYLVSLTGIVWGVFLLDNGSLPDSVFVLTTVVGINLIVHVFRFDRIDLFTPRKGEQPVPLLFDV